MVALALLVLAAGPAPGEYLLDGGGGLLKLSGGTFRLDVTGTNAHLCALQGEWKGDLGTVKDEASPCRVRFGARGNDVAVTPIDEEACRSWCGARAYFDGLYLKPARECRADAVKATRGAFKKAYDQKQSSRAVTTLRPLLERCARVLWRFDVMWIRNDLALAQHHAGDDAACLATLEPLGDLRLPPTADEGGSIEPTFDEEWKRLGKATRTNALLCGFEARQP
jgi:hypothetical protein